VKSLSFEDIYFASVKYTLNKLQVRASQSEGPNNTEKKNCRRDGTTNIPLWNSEHNKWLTASRHTGMAETAAAIGNKMGGGIAQRCAAFCCQATGVCISTYTDTHSIRFERKTVYSTA
jgi:hypothetical protein